MQNSPEILYAKDDSWLWAWLEDEKKRRAAQGIKEEPPFNPEEARELFRKYKARRMRRQLLHHAFLALFEPVDSRGFRAVCPTVENCAVEAPTREEAGAALIKEINQRLRAKMRAGETLPSERRSAEMVEVVLSE
jgi:hypothetical protein